MVNFASVCPADGGWLRRRVQGHESEAATCQREAAELGLEPALEGVVVKSRLVGEVELHPRERLADQRFGQLGFVFPTGLGPSEKDNRVEVLDVLMYAGHHGQTRPCGELLPQSRSVVAGQEPGG